MTERQTQAQTQPHTQPTQHHTCAKCAYDLTNIDHAGTCPECGTTIINGCIWCDYDLSGTDPEGNCPECGVPVVHSIGQSALGPVPTDLLRSVYTGYKLVTNLILIYIVSLITMFLLLVTVIANYPTIQYPFTVTAAIINNGIIFGIIFGWFKITTPLTGLPAKLDAPDKRSFVRIMLWISAGFTFISLIYGLIPSNLDPMAPPSVIDIIYSIISIISLAILFVLFISNVMYLGWFAKLVRNRKMARRSKHFVWSGPLITVVGYFLLFLGPLITLVLYWNMIEYIRRDLKKVIKARPDA